VTDPARPVLWEDPDRLPHSLRPATPPKQCTDESAHGEHEWYDGPLRVQCDGFVGRAGVPSNHQVEVDRSIATDRTQTGEDHA